MTIKKTLFNKGIITFYGLELGRCSSVQLEVDELYNQAEFDELGPTFAWLTGQKAYVRTELYDFDQNAMASIFTWGTAGQQFNVSNNRVGMPVIMHELRFDPIDGAGSSFTCPSAFGHWNGEMPNAADERAAIPIEFECFPLYDTGNTIQFDLGTQTTSQTTSYRAAMIALRDKLKNMTWTGGGEVFRKVLISAFPTTQFLSQLRPAAAIVRDMRETTDLHNQEFRECDVEIELIATTMSQLGQEGVIGRRAVATSSKSVGVLELEAEVRKQFQFMTRDDGITVQSIIDSGDSIYTLPNPGDQIVFGKKLTVKLYIDVANES